MRQQRHRRHAFIAKLREGVERSGLDLAKPVICAVSGGFDSTALLLGLHELSGSTPRVIGAHFNHRLRGAKSDADEAFVVTVCGNLGIEILGGRNDDKRHSMSEAEARRQRHSFLAQTARRTRTEQVALAHTMEDQAETLLLRMSRGAGVRGAAAMMPRRRFEADDGSSVDIFRPMLEITHAEARSYLDSKGIEARHDASNDDWRRYARNRIRHRVIPELREINPDVIKALTRFAGAMQLNSDLLDGLVEEEFVKSDVDLPQSFGRNHLTDLHPAIAAALLTRMHEHAARNDTHIGDNHIRKMLEIASKPGAGSYNLPGGVTFHADGDLVSVGAGEDYADTDAPFPRETWEAVLDIPGSADLGDDVEITVAMKPVPPRFDTNCNSDAWLSPDLLSEKRLTVRPRRAGDEFQPLGMEETVQLNRFMIASKLPRNLRDRAPVVVSNKSGKIAWVAGVRPAEWAKVLPEHDECLHLSLRRKRSPLA